jgi:hypothetical protein
MPRDDGVHQVALQNANKQVARVLGSLPVVLYRPGLDTLTPESMGGFREGYGFVGARIKNPQSAGSGPVGYVRE